MAQITHPHIPPIEPPAPPQPQHTTLPPSQPTLPPPRILKSSTTPPKLIAQGAEALLYHSTFLLPTLHCALKYRPPKPYRHPILDARLTKHRILSEARVLVKCRKEGVPVPAVYALDENAGWIAMEWVEGEVVRVRLSEWLVRRKRRREEVGGERADGGDEEEELKELMARVGRAVGRLHAIGVVHGDLTTSNLMLRPWKHAVSNENGDAGVEKSLVGEIILIDFGLASQSVQDEDRAVDLYVLERAFGSTHPRAEGLFGELLKAYGESFRGATVALKRLEDVRMRGRKRSMLG
jgi:TP53 regulating kinase and related kinases